MLDIVKHIDPVVGIDVHTVFTPAPTPIPHPHVGAVLDLREQMNAICPAIASAVNFVESKIAMANPMALIGMASSKLTEMLLGPREAGGNAPVKANGMLRSTVGTHSFHFPGLHFPLGAGFAPPDPIPSQDANSFMGSKTVLVNGDPLSYMALPSLSCWFVGIPGGGGKSPHMNRSHLSLPTSIQLPIPMGKRVVVGGMPTVDLYAIVNALISMAMMKVAKVVTKKIQKKIQTRKSNKKNGKNKTKNDRKNDPVNIITGEVVCDDLDFVITGRVPLVWSRSYAGQADTIGHLGCNWESVADTRLEVIKEDNQLMVIATLDDYETIFDGFPLEAGFSHRIYDGQNGHALYFENGHLILRTAQKIEYHYPIHNSVEQLHEQLVVLKEGETLTFWLNKMTNLISNGWLFERDEQNKLLQIKEICINQPTGRYLQCDYDHRYSHYDRLTKLTLYHQKDKTFSHTLVEYHYDEYDNLISVFDANGYPYHYFYTPHHLMIQHMNRNGFSFYYKYKKQTDGVERVIEAWADDQSYHYQFIYHLEYQETWSINSLNHKEILQYDDRNLLIACIDPLDGVTTYEYDGLCRLIAEVDPMGNKTEWIYDITGRIIEEKFPDNSSVQIEFNHNDDLAVIIDTESNQWNRQFSDAGQIISQQTPMGDITQYEYNQQGDLIRMVRAENHSYYYQYDELGFLRTLTYPDETLIQFKCDYLGNVVEQTDIYGNITVYHYDKEDMPVFCQYPDGRKLHCRYDKAGNIITIIENDKLQTHFQYWGVGLLTQRTEPDGSTIHYHYDTEGDLTAVENQKGEKWQLNRDELGRLIEEVDYWGASSRYYYNKAGYLVKTNDPLNNQIIVECDKLGRILSKMVVDKPTTQEFFAYDKRGFLLQADNALVQVERQYDNDGYLVNEIQLQAKLKAELSYEYNLTHQLTKQKQQINYNDQTEFTQQTRFHYDKTGKLISQQIDEHEPIQFYYDKNGRLISQALNSQLTHTFFYTASDQLQQQRIYKNNEIVDNIDYYYDEQGNLIRREDSLVGTDHYHYDVLGQITKHIDPMQSITNLVYDVTGNRYHTKRADESGRTIAFTDGIHYRLDKAGQLIERSENEKSYRLFWDEQGRLIGLHKKNREKTTYQYDALRRRVSKQLYDAQGRLTKIVYFIWDGDVFTSEVEINQPIETELPIAKAHFYTYYQNTFIPLVLQSKQQGIGSLAPPEETGYYFYQTDPNGMPLRLRDEQGQIVWLAHYSIFGNVERLKGHDVKQSLRLQGQYFDEESGLHYNRHRYYDPKTGVFISQDPIGLLGGINPYQFAPNIFGWVDPLGLKMCPERKDRYNKLREKGLSHKDAKRFSKSNLTQIEINGKNGKLAEALVLNNLNENEKVAVLGTQVYVKTPGQGRGRFVDVLIQDKDTGQIIGVEVKSGGATRSKTQIAKDNVITSGNGIFGKNAPADMNGIPLASQKTSDILISETNVPLWKLE